MEQKASRSTKSISSKINNFLEKHEDVKPKFISTTKIAEALFDDLNTPKAIRIMQI